VFCCRSVKKTLEEFLKRPGFADKCEQHKKCPRDPNLLGDIYDGRVWKNFKNAEGEPFFDAPNTFRCMLNLDWFQPYKDSAQSHTINTLLIITCFFEVPVFPYSPYLLFMVGVCAQIPPVSIKS